jgi:hypothetical protein
MNLSEKAVLVSLNASCWAGRKYDRKASDEVAEAHGVGTGAGRYNKILIGDDPAYVAVKRLIVEARQYHYEHTLPWTHDGARILPSAGYMDYAAAVRALKNQIDTAVAAFVAEYPVLRERARLRLGTLYREADYPDDIAPYFSFKVSVLPMPDARDFRVDLSQDEIDEVKAQVEAQLQEATNTAMRDVWDRLYAAVARMVDRLTEPAALAGGKKAKVIIKESLTGNLRDLCDLLPALNVTQDKALDDLRARVERDLLAHSPDALRDSKAVRATVATKARRLKADIAAGRQG